MASNPSFVQYIIDQCSHAGEMKARKMFGDYGLYCNDTIVGLICDNGLYIKPTAMGRALLRQEEMRPPYPGAKPYFFIDDIDDHDYLTSIVKATHQALKQAHP